MAVDHDVQDLDPFALMAAESARIDRYVSTLGDDGWMQPSACEGWTVKDVLGHLAGSEEYNRACLEDRIDDLMAAYTARGVTDVHSFNALGVADRRERPVGDVVDEWRAESAATRTDLAALDGGDLPTLVGPYPARWQGFHLAAELATHADDIDVPCTPEEAAERRAWRAKVARFMLREAKPDVYVEEVADGTRIRVGDHEAVLDDATFVAAASGRLPADAAVDGAIAAALDLAP